MRESQRINQFQNICFLFFSQRFDRGTMKVQICDQCGMLTSSIKDFNEHYQIHQSLLFQCKKCPKLFDTRNKLKWHVIRNHKGQVQCDECCKYFSCSTSLDRHKKNVHDKCSVSCENCIKIFLNR